MARVVRAGVSSGRSLVQSLKSASSGMGWRSSMAFVARQQTQPCEVPSLVVLRQPLDRNGLADPLADVGAFV
eukprot:5506671-Pyramimonas_sp.AAC.1